MLFTLDLNMNLKTSKNSPASLNFSVRSKLHFDGSAFVSDELLRTSNVQQFGKRGLLWISNPNFNDLNLRFELQGFHKQ